MKTTIPVEVAPAGGGGGGDGGRKSVGIRGSRWFPVTVGTGGGGGRSATLAPAVDSEFCQNKRLFYLKDVPYTPHQYWTQVRFWIPYKISLGCVRQML